MESSSKLATDVDFTDAAEPSNMIRLHRYFKSHVYETLCERALKVSDVADWNDSFEFAFREPGPMTRDDACTMLQDGPSDEILRIFFPGVTRAELRNHIEHALPNAPDLMMANWNDPNNRSDRLQNLTEAAKAFKMCSFSSSNLTPIEENHLWGQYADGEMGMRIGFAFKNANHSHYCLKEVFYQQDRVEFDLISAIGRNRDINHINKIFHDVMCTKNESWKNEKEVRLFVDADHCYPQDDYWFMKFDPNMVVESIDFGVKCQEAEKLKIAELVKKEYPTVKLRSAKMHDTDYRLDYVPYP